MHHTLFHPIAPPRQFPQLNFNGSNQGMPDNLCHFYKILLCLQTPCLPQCPTPWWLPCLVNIFIFFTPIITHHFTYHNHKILHRINSKQIFRTKCLLYIPILHLLIIWTTITVLLYHIRIIITMSLICTIIYTIFQIKTTIMLLYLLLLLYHSLGGLHGEYGTRGSWHLQDPAESKRIYASHQTLINVPWIPQKYRPILPTLMKTLHQTRLMHTKPGDDVMLSPYI